MSETPAILAPSQHYTATHLIPADLLKVIEEKVGGPIIMEIDKPIPSNSFLSRIYDQPVNFFIYTADKKFNVARWKMVQLPGCCGACVSFHAYVIDGYKNRGLGSLFNTLRMNIARMDGYTIMLCTDKMSNTPQRRILEKNGWKDIFKFTNRRTWNDLFISIKELR